MMNNALNGALLSGLVFPGIGQIMLKHYTRGAVLMLAFTAILWAIIKIAVQQGSAILERIESGGGTIDISTITDTATQVSSTSASHTFTLLLWLLIFCWIIGIVDAFRIGRSKDIQGRLVN